MKRRNVRALLTVKGLMRLFTDMQTADALAKRAIEKSEEIRKRYEAALLFAPPDFDPAKDNPREASKSATGSPKLQPRRKPVKQAPRRTWSKVTWISEVQRVVEAHPEGITNQGLLTEVLKTSLGKETSKGYKGFYHAITRLRKRGKLVKHGTRIISARVVRELEARGEKLPPADRHPGGSGAIVVETLGKHPNGLTGPQLQAIVGAIPEAPKSIREYRHYIYNILSTLITSGQVVKRRGTYRLPEPEGARH